MYSVIWALNLFSSLKNKTKAAKGGQPPCKGDITKITPMKVMICESEEVLLMAIEFRLKKQGYEVCICRKDMDLAETLVYEKPNLVLFDFNKGSESGLGPVRTIKEIHPPAGILMLADPDEEDGILDAFELGINDFISKPFKPAELLLRVQRIAEAL